MVDLSRLMQDAATLEVIEKSAIEAQVLRHDVEAYRACLGYTVSGDHDGRLSDGTLPNNGIAEALNNECRTLSAQNSAQAMQIDELERELSEARAELEKVKRELLGVKEYREKNPLGGPAKVFDAMADCIRAGDDFNKVIADYGWCPVERAERAEAALADAKEKNGELHMVNRELHRQLAEAVTDGERLKFHAEEMAHYTDCYKDKWPDSGAGYTLAAYRAAYKDPT